MITYTERFAEMPVTEWNAASVKVTVSHPDLKQSLTSQIMLSSEDLDILRSLNPPKQLELATEGERNFLLAQWNMDKKLAENVRDMIAMKIANHITQAFINEDR